MLMHQSWPISRKGADNNFQIGGISKGLFKWEPLSSMDECFLVSERERGVPATRKRGLGSTYMEVSTFSLVATFILKFFFTIVCRFYCEAIIVISATSRCFRSIQFTLYAYSCASSSHWGCFSSPVELIPSIKNGYSGLNANLVTMYSGRWLALCWLTNIRRWRYDQNPRNWQSLLKIALENTRPGQNI